MACRACATSVVVCDVGTSTTRLGYAGNAEPTFALPTVCAWRDRMSAETFAVGDAAATMVGPGVQQRRPLEHGLVVNWDVMEEYWCHLFNRYLCVEPQDVGVLLTEAAVTPYEQREMTAEIMFESFGVPRLCIGSQALFVLSSVGDGCDTAVVVESGAGVTQVVPIVAGYAVSGAARRFPVAGWDITQYVLKSLREHERGIEAERALEVAERVKTRYGYTADDIACELARAESNLPSYVIHHTELHSRTGAPYSIDVGYERFLAPETMFQPDLLAAPSAVTASACGGLPAVIDSAVWSCPMDGRRPLCANIIVSGGNARFAHFAKRLNHALQRALDERSAAVMAASGGTLCRQVKYEVNVRDHSQATHAVWRGASAFAASPEYATAAVAREAYMECGASVMRQHRI
ncbi:putative actin-related protein 3 arp3 [Leishmania major strain Friedlin]|uniref:Actin-related protein 3 n=1 Tax=Leishmania major TaxID=5664 RepID=Q4QF44_LEIMA|nr:putative actin-related protein 3 arp3 [Leishmania major strain Friedlin]ABF58724.1 actin-related protein 3 [Leishmania major]CAG9571585.1 actin-related_protein_3_-_putative_arp3 [Leishmania major strain Friedlin]CAJ03366.1 putative actin-related protein 3 arp3 [Leishmania major strain Friedlin]|eukprot:XP_001682054.1 putative actin-related protein 3 arp3 [Leishmania major strain Friedlin]